MDKNVTLSDAIIRQLLYQISDDYTSHHGLKKTLRVADVEYMTIYPYLHQPPNFSLQYFLTELEVAKL